MAPFNINLKKTSFNPVWRSKANYNTWLAAVDKDQYSARCTLCRKTFSLSNMGVQALESHIKGKGHQKLTSSAACSMSLKAFCTSSATMPTSAVQPDNTSSADQAPSATLIPVSADPALSNISDSLPTVRDATPRGLKAFLAKGDVTKAEIIWCLQAAFKHESFRACADSVKLFPSMFPDSEIALKMKLQRTKIAYVTTFGLGPYFHRELQLQCKDTDIIVIGFDESFNKVAQKSQMDAFVRFWDPSKTQVVSRYYGSSFLGHATAKLLLKSFFDITKGLEEKRLLQVSMDGPHVNKKFLEDLKATMKEENPDGPVPLNIGSCGLHTIHNAYKKSMQKTGWDLLKFLRALYFLFNLSPARREDYIRYSNSTTFPLKFCAVRWVKNFMVAGRAQLILPNVRKYVQGVKEDKKEPDCNSFKEVSSALEDKSLAAKLAFFQTIASDVELFLTLFQSDAPLAPLLYESLQSLLRRVMTRFVKEEVLNSTTNLVNLKITDEANLLPVKKIDLGFGVRSALRETKNLKDADILRFRSACRIALQEFCISLSKNSPLLYPLTRGISAFDPTVALDKINRSVRLTKALDIFVENKWLSGCEADTVKRTCEEVWQGPLFIETMTNFSQEIERLDNLWLKVIPTSSEFASLRSFLKMVLILSHGNAFAERGFSVNKEILIENLSEETLVAQRRVYDAISYFGGIENVQISKKMIHAARNSHDLYQEALKKKEKERTESQRQRTDKRQKLEQVKDLEIKKQKLLENARQKASEIQTEINKLL